MKKLIKALILDVDGVLVGNKPGYNFPHPHPDVIAALKSVRKNGTYISLCTAKPAFAIARIIQEAHLDNPHITDGGAVLADPLHRAIAAEHTIPKALGIRLARFYRDAGVYLEFNTSSDYYIPADQISEVTAKHAQTLQRQPTLVDDFDAFLSNESFVKIFLIARDEEEKNRIAQSFAGTFSKYLTLSWTLHPNTLPWQFGIVTAQGVSKREGALEIAEQLHVPIHNILGVGDTTHDWQFMECCGYAATLANATDELRQLVQARQENGFIGPSVNSNGMIEILRHFALYP